MRYRRLSQGEYQWATSSRAFGNLYVDEEGYVRFITDAQAVKMNLVKTGDGTVFEDSRENRG